MPKKAGEIAPLIWFEELDKDNVAQVGGKNASLGEMIRGLARKGIAVPPGFALTAASYWRYVEFNGLRPQIETRLERLETGRAKLSETGRALRQMFLRGRFPPDVERALIDAYRELGRRLRRADPDVAVRSSATAEDLPHASFAGQHESFLNVRGERALVDSCRKCLASLFADRAIAYRAEKGFDHLKVALSVGVQAMARSDLGGSGVMFTLDTESGFPNVVLIDSAWGLGESVVQGTVEPDAHVVFKPLLANKALVPIVSKRLGAKAHKLVYGKGRANPTVRKKTTPKERARFVLDDREALTLARWAVEIELHYGRPMDIEWAKDGRDGKLYIVQARPETVQSRTDSARLRRYRLLETGAPLVEGRAIGEGVAVGPASLLQDASAIDRFADGAILVTRTTDPDWVPIMKKARAIVTEEGGRTSHAAIVSRELGLPAIVGARGAMAKIASGKTVTVSCAEGERGRVYSGALRFKVEELDLSKAPKTRTKVMLNQGDPGRAFRWWRLPSDGVGLARMEFVISDEIGIHPMALARPESVRNPRTRREIARRTKDYPDAGAYFVDRLAQGLARIAASVWPNPTIVRTSDFKSNEYAGLIGGDEFEPREENPMLGFRGAGRYISERYAAGFALECRTLVKLRRDIGLTNVKVMIPFCRTLAEADRVLKLMARHGLKRGRDGLELYMMCELPANVVLAEEFAKRFDGFSIGSNDLTQLVLGVDRDSSALSGLFDERDEAVKRTIADAIARAHKAGIPVGLCGQAPSDAPEFADFLVDCGIDSISVIPASFLKVKQRVAAAERRARRRSKRRTA